MTHSGIKSSELLVNLTLNYTIYVKGKLLKYRLPPSPYTQYLKTLFRITSSPNGTARYHKPSYVHPPTCTCQYPLAIQWRSCEG